MYLIRIYGVGRSGSTVIGAYLAGHFDKAVHIGEAVRFDRKELVEANPSCTCGFIIDDCPFWSKMDHSSYRSVVESISGFNDHSVVVDSSKSGKAPDVVGVTTVPLHLVKDPRASTWSWFRSRALINPSGRKENLKRVSWRHLPRMVLSTYKNFLKIRLGLYGQMPLLSYETFVAEPKRTLQWLSGKLGLPIREQYNGRANHGIGGNITRYAFDGRLVNEEGWRHEAPVIFRIFTTIVYAPILLYLRRVKQRF